MDSSGQSVTEYLVIIAVILIMVLIVVGVMGWFPGFGTGLNETQSKAYWRTVSPLSLRDWKITSNSGEAQFVFQNMGIDPIIVTEITVGGTPIVVEPDTEVPAGSIATITGLAGKACPSGSNYEYDIKIDYDVKRVSTGLTFLGKKPIVGECELSSGSPGAITIGPALAISYQDEGTLECDDTSLLSALDGIFGPDACGTVDMPYYATGTSPRYFDAVALKFNVSGFEPQNYNAILRFYARDGGYSGNWHHYLIHDSFQDNSTCYDSSPPCGGSISFANGYEGWIEVPLADSTWENGEFSLRLWDAAIDRVELRLDPV
jgi:hypothetical protein